jgi:hypothetical protein
MNQFFLKKCSILIYESDYTNNIKGIRFSSWCYIFLSSTLSMHHFDFLDSPNDGPVNQNPQNQNQNELRDGNGGGKR